MKQRLFLAFAMLMTSCLFCWAGDGTLIAERDYTGIEEFSGWNQFGDGQEGNVSVDPDGLAITVGSQTGQLWQPQVMVIPDEILLQKGGNYKVVVTAKFPCNGTLQINLGSWSGNYQNPTDVVATGDFQEVEMQFPNFEADCIDASGNGNAHVLLHCGDFLGTTIVKRVQVYKMVGIGETYAVLDNNTLTFYYDGQKDFRSGTKYSIVDNGNGPQWEGNTSISVVRFHSSFADVRPTSTVGWFSLLTSLTKIEDIQYLNTSEVTNMGYMFNGCSGLRILNLSYFDTSKVTDMSCMFRGCDDLTTITVGDKWKTQNVTSSDDMFSDCPSLVGGKGTVFDPYHTNKEYARIDGDVSGETSVPGYLTRRPSGYAVYTSSNKTFTFYNDGKMDEKTGDKYFLTVEGEVPGWFGKMASVTNVVFHESFASAFPVSTSDWFNHFEKLTTIEGIEYLNTDKVTEMSAMFNSCYQLKDLDLSTFNTSNVTNMTMMFSYCSQLEELDLRNFDTSNVTYMGLMFSGCSQLTELDLRSFDTHNVTTMQMMFSGCSNLVTIYANDDKWNTDKIESGGGMFNNCSSLVGGKGTKCSDYGAWSPQVGALYARIDGGPGSATPGYLTSKLGAYALYDNRASIKTLTFYYDDQRDRRFGTKKYDLNIINITPEWISDNCYIEKVVFDESFKKARPTSTYQWFSGLSQLTSIDLGNLNTSEVTNMGWMFQGCSNLTSLVLSSLDTGNVTEMSGMFEDCSSLTSLDLSSFDTKSVTSMAYMFNKCSSLKTITVGKDWNTGNVESSTDMFLGCASLMGGAGTTYKKSYVDMTYARIDGGPGSATPGYLTVKIYDLTIAGTTVTSLNKDDILSDGGSVQFDGRNTLTLENVSILSESTTAIYNTIDGLYIVAKGTNTVESRNGMGCYSNGSIHFLGNGILTLKGNQKGLGAGNMESTISVSDGIHLICQCTSTSGGGIGGNSTKTKLEVSGRYTTLEAISVNYGKGCIYDLYSLTLNDGQEIVSPSGVSFNTSMKAVCYNSGGLYNGTVVIKGPSGIATGVDPIENGKLVISNNEWYTVDGRKLSGKPTQKGIYIQHGKKVVIR